MRQIIDFLSQPAYLLTVIIVIISICIVAVVILLLHRLRKEKKVTRAALELKKITNSICAGLVHFIIEDNYRIHYASKGFYDILGYSKNEAKSLNKNSILDYADPRDIPIFESLKEKADNEGICYDVRMRTKDDKVIYMLMNGNSTIGKDGKHTIAVVLVDISEKRQLQENILLEGERYRIATELSKDIIFEYNIKTDEIRHAEKFRDVFAIDAVIKNFAIDIEKRREYIHPDDWGIYLELCQEFAEGKNIIEAELRFKDRLGKYIWCQVMGKTIYDENKCPIRVIGKITNVDAKKRELEALEFKATRDPLTGVYNKEVTIKKIEKFISGNKKGQHMLMFIDFDDFKQINDSYGHLRGDKVLTYVIGQIKEVFSEGEIIGRMGGDEFVVFVGNITHQEEITDKVIRLKDTLNTIYQSDDYSISISASIGVALYPMDGLHYEQLMERADQALYRVKRQGKRGYMLYQPIT